MKLWVLAVCSSALLLAACGGDDNAHTQSTASTASSSAQTTSQAPVQSTETAQSTVSAAASTLVEKTTEKVQTVAKSAVEQGEQAVNAATQAVQQAVNSAPNGQQIFSSRCASCHGAKAELKALGASKEIAQMSTAEIHAALLGYQSGSYGGQMKAVMQGQAKGLSAAEVDALANYIPTLK